MKHFVSWFAVLVAFVFIMDAVALVATGVETWNDSLVLLGITNGALAVLSLALAWVTRKIEVVVIPE